MKYRDVAFGNDVDLTKTRTCRFQTSVRNYYVIAGARRWCCWCQIRQNKSLNLLLSRFFDGQPKPWRKSLWSRCHHKIERVVTEIYILACRSAMSPPISSFRVFRVRKLTEKIPGIPRRQLVIIPTVMSGCSLLERRLPMHVDSSSLLIHLFKASNQ